MKRNFRRICLFLLLVIAPGFSSTQEASSPVYVIRTIDFSVTGRTRPFALIYNGDFKEGEEIRGTANLEKYIRDKTQLLINQRVLEEVRIDYTLGEAESGGEIPVHLLITVKDTWNIIAVPYPKYDTNTGFELIIKARDYNLFGTMNPLRIDLGYKYDENNKNSVVFEIDSDTPFRAWGYNWNINFDHFFSYRPEVEEPFYYKNVTGLSMELPFKTTTFTFGFEESITLNEENEDRYKAQYGDFQNGPYMRSKTYTSWEIPTGLNISNYGELTYTPELSAAFNYGFPQSPLDEFRNGPFLDLSHSLGFNRVNWIGNYRRGFDVSAENTYSYNFHKIEKNEKNLNFNYIISGAGFFIINDNFGFSGRLQFRHWFYHNPDYNDKAGDALRGILDKAVQADYMLSLNLDFPFRVFRFLPSQWFGVSKLRFFDFDLHFSPVIDLALYHDPEPETTFHPKNILASGGVELIVFPAFMRSLYIRASFAWNFVEFVNDPGGSYLPSGLPVIPKLPGGDNREIFIGIGHHY
ncbi:MAG: hypothetical protein LBT93_07630 [Treponema sp.]|nr:hypothetical protein [Treponema sp.]